jgi:hypothetical protein
VKVPLHEIKSALVTRRHDWSSDGGLRAPINKTLGSRLRFSSGTGRRVRLRLYVLVMDPHPSDSQVVQER